MKIMSFNLRFQGEWDGINAFFKRLPRVLEVINNEKADIIGFQEVTDDMRLTLREMLTDYITVGCGRNDDYHGEAMLIAYRKDVFELISLDNVWLSETPRVPGTKYGLDHSPCPRMYTCLLLKHKDIEKPFRFINTHLDHAGKLARVLEAEQLISDISNFDELFIMTGDFNAEPTSPEIKLITEKLADIGCVDCTRNLGPTFHGFGKLTETELVKIDYIFSNFKCKNAYKVDDFPVCGQYYSDHNAVCAELDI